MATPIQDPPLLLTKRLTAFLQDNRTPRTPTLLVTSPTGKLLAHASSQPVALLRTHATVAASLLSIHTSSSPNLSSALPGSHTPPSEIDDETDANLAPKDPIKPVTITVQLSGGTVLIRRLRCGLLFVCIGPPSAQPGTGDSSVEAVHHNGDTLLPVAPATAAAAPATISTSPSEVDSLVSAGAQTATSLESHGASAVVAMRRHATEMARWLDDKLGTLVVPDEGVNGE